MASKKRWTIWARRVGVGVLAFLVAGEIGVRLTGMVDFPTYSEEKDVGYIIRPSQSGAFLHTRDWVFNDRSMGVAEPWAKKQGKVNLLLIGNSIIMGGNAYRQAEKVSPLLQAAMGDSVAVWPMAIGGWSTVNETANLERNPDVADTSDFFVWELMGGGFSRLSPWRSDLVFPRERPTFALLYVARKYVLPKFIHGMPSELPVTGDATSTHVEHFERMVERLSKASGRAVPGIFVLYPVQKDMAAQAQGDEWLADRRSIEGIASKYGVRVLDIARAPQWRTDIYRDGTHPTAEGNAVLAKILAASIRDALRAN